MVLRRSLASHRGAPHGTRRRALFAGFGVDARHGRFSERLGGRAGHHRPPRAHAGARRVATARGRGALGGGIAHDFKNVLTIIRSYTDLVADEVPTDSPALEDLDVMREATDRATALISQLLAFSRIQPQTVARWDLNEIVAGIQKMVERPLGEDIELGLELTSFPLPLACDRSQLEQVLLNLAVNARDAMPNGGRLRFRTSLRRIADSYMHPVGFRVPPGKYACIEVSDEGLGMEPQVLERIFEPFFTTKASRGSGLGLATAYGIVKQHGGFITARSRLGAGSTFELLLPLGSAEAGPTKDTRLGRPFFPRAEVGPGRRVLLVEDDPEVRRAITHMLERKGHVVRASGDPDQVLGWLAEADTHFDVLMTDVVMPRMNGLTLAARARELRPGVAVVLMSGRDDFDELAQAGRSASVFVQKPASPELILEAIEEAMRLIGKGRKT
ncbi:MAG: response regulator [Sandaracinus sp.]|nr:response regulator [Sandaracinus sp.]MCB9621348.1 response regulator [Sandaracinus sp.]MCB9632442.1 response regulator [Sandaracinus sp.]